MSETTRILFVTADLRTGGAERHIVTVVPALDRSRYAPTVYCLRGRGGLFGELVDTGVPVVSLDLGESNRSAPQAVRRLIAHIRQTRPHVVMTQGFYAGVLGRLAAKLAQVPVTIVWKHNVGHLGRHGFTERLGERLLKRATTRYIGVSYAQIAYLTGGLGVDPEKIRIVYNALDPAQYATTRSDNRALGDRLGITDGDFVIAITAVLREEKDHRTMLRSFSLVLREVPHALLLVIGGGPDLEQLQNLADVLGVAERVRFLGERRDVVELLTLADVAALSSTTIENFPYSILEAMAVNRPAVCTAVGGLPEMIEDGVTGYLVPPLSPGAMAERLIDVARSAPCRADMGQAAGERLRTRFNVAGAADRLGSIIDEALRARAVA